VNWRLVFELSLFGLAMGIATVFVIPSNVEPVFWLAIFIVCAYIIAVRCRRLYFVHGLVVGIVNSIWITASHVLLFNQYIARHPQEAAMMKSMPLPDSPRVMMLLTGPVIGVISGCVLGLFAFIASWLVRRRSAVAH
jgi:hypothetical protein